MLLEEGRLEVSSVNVPEQMHCTMILSVTQIQEQKMSFLARGALFEQFEGFSHY